MRLRWWVALLLLGTPGVCPVGNTTVANVTSPAAPPAPQAMPPSSPPAAVPASDLPPIFLRVGGALVDMQRDMGLKELFNERGKLALRLLAHALSGLLLYSPIFRACSLV